MAAARKSSRYGHRDATMILIGYRHSLRAQIELATGRLHVRRAKNGSPSVHPMRGDEMRALRRTSTRQPMCCYEAANVLLTRVARWSALKAWGVSLAKRS